MADIDTSTHHPSLVPALRRNGDTGELICYAAADAIEALAADRDRLERELAVLRPADKVMAEFLVAYSGNTMSEASAMMNTRGTLYDLWDSYKIAQQQLATLTAQLAAKDEALRLFELIEHPGEVWLLARTNLAHGVGAGSVRLTGAFAADMVKRFAIIRAALALPQAAPIDTPACADCNDTGSFCIGTSGSDSDGNAAVLERCPSCGYGDTPAAGGEGAK